MKTERKRKPHSVMVKMNKQSRSLRNARIVGPVRLTKHKLRGHLQIEISGIEIDGFGHDELDIDRPA